jgi:arginine decarboxylase
MSWTIDESKDLYNIEGWGIGYFDINEQGHVTVHPTRNP